MCYNTFTEKERMFDFDDKECNVRISSLENRGVIMSGEDKELVASIKAIIARGNDVEIRAKKDGSLKVIELKRIQRLGKRVSG